MSGELQKTIADLVALAAKEPIPLIDRPPRLDKFATRLDQEHILLLVVEWSPPHEAMCYHASLSRNQGEKEPALGLCVSILMGIEALLGPPIFFAYPDKIVHWYWGTEGLGAEVTPGPQRQQ